MGWASLYHVFSESFSGLDTWDCLARHQIHQMDVKTTFVNGVIEEEVYIEQPEGSRLK